MSGLHRVTVWGKLSSRYGRLEPRRQAKLTAIFTIRYVERMNSAAANILRRARSVAGLTQAELAERVGVTQSVVSAYESGRRDPSVTTLRRLVEGTGQTLELALRSPEDLPRDHLRKHREELRRRLTEMGARSIRVFGSVARGDDGPGSDIDLLVDLPESAGLFTLLAMRGEAERILGNAVDLVPTSGVKIAMSARIHTESVPL